MPKYLHLIFILILCLDCSCREYRKEAAYFQNKPKKVISIPDTITIEDQIAHQPFLTDTISLEAIRLLFGDNIKIKRQPIKNQYVKGQIDTLITFYKGQSSITMYLVSKEKKCFYKSADIKDNYPIFQQSIQVGKSKKEIQQAFPILAKYKILPDYIEIATGEGTDYLYLIFSQDTLKRVEYKPYLE
ncbi:hypothetical protein [Adhaeribacter aquaticus]|uniref:hypothetical protein n=1 Tax=Adhaeribacter aquaticus TaxID=299567 RepID=UPI00040551DB|nr:hypothetical protein [Adhaeribacter aquaticus]